MSLKDTAMELGRYIGLGEEENEKIRQLEDYGEKSKGANRERDERLLAREERRLD